MQLASAVFKAAIRDRLTSANPCEGVKPPAQRWHDDSMQVMTRDQFMAVMAVLADPYGRRWPSAPERACDGANWSDCGRLRSIRRAGWSRSSGRWPRSPGTSRSSPVPLRVWRPGLVRAGLLGDVTATGSGIWRGMWEDASGATQYTEFSSEKAPVDHVARNCHGPCPRFHDVRHSFATWLVSDGVPVNDVAKVMGHEQASTTPDRYTHASPAYVNRLREVFADFPLTPAPKATPETR